MSNNTAEARYDAVRPLLTSADPLMPAPFADVDSKLREAAPRPWMNLV